MPSTQRQLETRINRLARALCYMQTTLTITDRYMIERTTTELAEARVVLLAIQDSSDRSE